MDKFNKHMAIFDSLGISTNQSYSEAVEELITLHLELLKEKAQQDKRDFRINLYNIQKIQN